MQLLRSPSQAVLCLAIRQSHAYIPSSCITGCHSWGVSRANVGVCKVGSASFITAPGEANLRHISSSECIAYYNGSKH